MLPLTLKPVKLLENLHAESGAAPIPGAVWYVAGQTEAGLVYTFPQGALASATYLTADMLLGGNRLSVFSLWLQEGAEGPVFRMNFGLLNQCSARMRVPLEAVNQNRWRYPREGAWLKPMCGGDRVNLSKVDRMQLRVIRKGPHPTRFCMTPVTATLERPALLDALLLPKGKLLDEVGQSTLHTWESKSEGSTTVTRRLEMQLASADEQHLPEDMARWGGWSQKRFDSTGFFHTHHNGKRWWLVDPDGNAFWSSGLDCVRFGIESAYEGLDQALAWLPNPEGTYKAAYALGREKVVDYLRANFIRAFGAGTAFEKWSKIALSQLRAFGFNTVANWSDWEIAREKVPYTRPMRDRALAKLPNVYRDFPDIYHPDFENAAAEYAAQLRNTVDDPAFIGYFLMNEPTWGFAQETPAAGMLYNTPKCYSRSALAEFLHQRHGTDAGLSKAWGFTTTLNEIAVGSWNTALSAAAQVDLADFSEVMVTRYFGILSQACWKVDPKHLNLGIRYYTVPPPGRWKACAALTCLA